MQKQDNNLTQKKGASRRKTSKEEVGLSTIPLHTVDDDAKVHLQVVWTGEYAPTWDTRFNVPKNKSRAI